MIVLVSADGRPAQQLLVTKRTAVGAVQALLGLQCAKTASIEWLIDDGTWAAADPDARLYELASDLKGDGSSAKKAFKVRGVPLAFSDRGETESQDGAALAGATTHVASAADTTGRPPRSTADAACAPASPKQLSEAPAPSLSDVPAPLPPPVLRPGSASTAAAAAAGAAAAAATSTASATAAVRPVDDQLLAPPVGRTDGLPPTEKGLRHSALHGDLPLSPAASGVSSSAADGCGAQRSGSGASAGGDGEPFEAVSRARLQATLPLLATGSHIAVVDPRRPARDAMAGALLRALPELMDTSCAVPRAFRPLRLTFDRVRPFQAGLDGFWRWVLEGLHAAAADLFPATGLPGDASGFEEAFSADRVRAAPPVVLICSEACALAEASSWFVSRFLGTLRDMGNEQHRFFLHAVAMIGGEPLAKVDMEAYMCKMSTSLSSTLESTQQLRRSSRSSGRSHSGSVSRRSASSAMSKRSNSHHGGSRKHEELQRGSANSGLSGGSGGSSGKSGTSASSAAAAAAPPKAAGVRRSVSSSSAVGARYSRQLDGRLETLHSAEFGSEPTAEHRRRRSADSSSPAAAEAAVVAARLRHHEGSPAGSGNGSSTGGGGGDATATARTTRTTSTPATTPDAAQPRSPANGSGSGKPLSEKVRRLAAAFARGDPGGGSTASGADGVAAGA